MPTPNDYSLNVPDPTQAFMQGMQNGMGMQENQIKLQQQQTALAMQQQQQQALQNFYVKPDKTADDYAQATLAIPGMRENFKQAWDMQNTQQQQASLQHNGEVASALTMGRPDVAIQLLNDRADALRNSGAKDADVNATKAMAEMVRLHPELAAGLAQAKLISTPGGDKVWGNIKTAATMPADVTKAGADARSAVADADTKEVTAANAPTAAVLGNQKTAQEIRASQLAGKISELNTKISQANSETERGKLTLERDKWVQEQQKLNQTQGNATQDAMDSITQSLQQVQAIKNHPGLKSGVGFGSDMASWFAGSDGRDVRAMVDTLKSQQFLTAVKQMTGTGSLSDAEGARIERAVSSLDPGQSYNQFKNSIGVIEASLVKAQQKLIGRGQLPKQGDAFVMAHPKLGNIDEGFINQMLMARPGMTRDQVIQFLRQSGGK